jgi:hypothetical protein
MDFSPFEWVVKLLFMISITPVASVGKEVLNEVFLGGPE